MRTKEIDFAKVYITRKIFHMLTGAVGVGLYYLTSLNAKDVGINLLIFGFVALVFDFVRTRVNPMNKFTIRIFRKLMKPKEYGGVSSFAFYAIGCAGSLILFYEPFAILSILFLIFADPLASIVGQIYGTQKIHKEKTLEGTLTFFVVSFSILMIYGLMFFPVNIHLFVFSLLTASGCALVELCSTKINDNLSVPIAAAAFMSFLDLIIPMV